MRCRNAAQCHYFSVYNARLPRLLQAVGSIGRGISFFGNAVVYGTEKYVIACCFVFDDFFQRMAGTADVSGEACRCCRGASVQMNAFQISERRQLEMLVCDDTFQTFRRKPVQ